MLNYRGVHASRTCAVWPHLAPRLRALPGLLGALPLPTLGWDLCLQDALAWNEELFYVFNYDKPTGVFQVHGAWCLVVWCTIHTGAFAQGHKNSSMVCVLCVWAGLTMSCHC